MVSIIKLRDLSGRIHLLDEFEAVYSKALAEAAASKDKEKIKALRSILHDQVRFVLGEMLKAKKEESLTKEVIQ